ncbi:hypothetical protein FJT64_007227 [Amphibalanus amphitrite]|uniref:Uncharacterized protein n=1 Tax=Amphibalanus amphitrite TaxID=1232801 RepID=A0A6A4VQJ6_AMPAM|nr:hypothetical protein FJT64_007227 [Amphibalanus amphitrite]
MHREVWAMAREHVSDLIYPNQDPPCHFCDVNRSEPIHGENRLRIVSGGGWVDWGEFNVDIPERRKCPDMVLLNNGIWYSGRVPYMFQFHQCEQFTMFRRGLQRLVPPLIQLARRTLTVWKLEEAMLFEFVRDKHEPELTKTEYMALVVVQQALVYEMSLQK